MGSCRVVTSLVGYALHSMVSLVGWSQQNGHNIEQIIDHLKYWLLKVPKSLKAEHFLRDLAKILRA